MRTLLLNPQPSFEGFDGGALVMSVVRHSFIFIGVLFLAVYFFPYPIALARADLSFVLSLNAVSYIFAAVLARVFLKEDITWLRWAGTIVIIVGITLIALDGRQRTGLPVPEAHGANYAFSEGLKR